MDPILYIPVEKSILDELLDMELIYNLQWRGALETSQNSK